MEVGSVENNTAITNLKSKKKKIGTTDNQCPVCLKPITEHDSMLIDQEKNTIQTEIDQLEILDTELKAKIDDLKTKKAKAKQLVIQQTACINNCRESLRKFESLKDVVVSLEARLAEIDTLFI